MKQLHRDSISSERRSKSRITCDVPAMVRGLDEKGGEFEENARVMNISADGIFMLVNRSIYIGKELSVHLTLPIGSLETNNPKLVTDGIVVRGESYPSGVTGVAVKFTHHHFQ